ncbi:NlpC/P60 family protein [Streptomyces boninensis]|uniref:C40 family peptidase n=1 Tax=Streptomyces boninensis TaxID=2039455 RepID=UPI003B20FB7B
MSKAVLALIASVLAVVLLAAAAVTGVLGVLGPTPATAAGQSAPSRYAITDIPRRMLALYRRAAPECPGLDWTILAAIGKVETDHARIRPMVSSAGAVGPMQFLPSTFQAYKNPVPPGGKKPPTPWDPVDSVYAAARLLCANGARNDKNLRRAIFSYNHATWYVNKVLRIAASYAASVSAARVDGRPPTIRAAVAVAFARNQIGHKYVWGGDGPAEGGFDCSGLTKAAYGRAGIRLPRIAQAQYEAGPRLPRGTRIRPGDLVFFGTPSNVHHVGIATSATRMINAPKPGTRVREEAIRYPGDDYLGATRPAAPGR